MSFFKCVIVIGVAAACVLLATWPRQRVYLPSFLSTVSESVWGRGSISISRNFVAKVDCSRERVSHLNLCEGKFDVLQFGQGSSWYNCLHPNATPLVLSLSPPASASKISSNQQLGLYDNDSCNTFTTAKEVDLLAHGVKDNASEISLFQVTATTPPHHIMCRSSHNASVSCTSGLLVLHGWELSTSTASSMSGLVSSDPIHCPIVKWAHQPPLMASEMLDHWAPSGVKLELIDAGPKVLPDAEEALLCFGGPDLVKAAARSDAPHAGSPSLPQPKAGSSAQGVACPPQWLPMLLAMHSYDYDSLAPLSPQLLPPLVPLLPLFPLSPRPRRRALQTNASRYVNSSSQLITALDDSAVNRVLLRAGTCELIIDHCTGLAICPNRAVTIEAEVPGSVVLDAQGGRQVFYIGSGGAAELIGLNIMGGESLSSVRFAAY